MYCTLALGKGGGISTLKLQLAKWLEVKDIFLKGDFEIDMIQNIVEENQLDLS